MAKQKEEGERLNPKAVLRALIKSLPDGCNEQDAHTVTALWAFCDEFIKADDVEAGNFILTGTVSYGQLGNFCCMSAGGMKKRMMNLRAMGIVTWKVTQHGIKFEVVTGVPGGTGVPTSRVDDACATRPGSYSGAGQVGTREIEVATPGSEVGTGVPPLAFDLALSGEEQLAKTTTSSCVEREQNNTTPTPRALVPVEFKELIKQNGTGFYVGLTSMNPLLKGSTRRELEEVFPLLLASIKPHHKERLGLLIDYAESLGAKLVYGGVPVGRPASTCFVIDENEL